MQKWDKYGVGVALGLLLPALFCVAYLSSFNLWFVFRSFGHACFPLLSKLFMLSVFPNMALIFVFYTLDAWRLSKGVLLGAFPYMLAAIVFTL